MPFNQKTNYTLVQTLNLFQRVGKIFKGSLFQRSYQKSNNKINCEYFPRLILDFFTHISVLITKWALAIGVGRRLGAATFILFILGAMRAVLSGRRASGVMGARLLIHARLAGLDLVRAYVVRLPMLTIDGCLHLLQIYTSRTRRYRRWLRITRTHMWYIFTNKLF